MKRAVLSLSVAVGLALTSTVLASCSSSTDAPSSSTTGATKSSGEHAIVSEPVVYSHRGASGYRPEHTLAAYRLAVQEGADYIEPDLVMTRDGVLVDRHEPEIGGTTDVAAHPEFAGRRTAKVLDGKPVTGWWVQDFTLAELKTLRAKERLPKLRPDSAAYDGRFEVPTLEEVLDLRDELSAQSGRTVGVIPEIKHSSFLHAAGFDPEQALMKALTAHGLNRPDAELWVQSFELAPLVRLDNELGYRAKLIFLVNADGSPYDLVAKGDPRSYTDLLQPPVSRSSPTTSTDSVSTSAESSRSPATAPWAPRRHSSLMPTGRASRSWRGPSGPRTPFCPWTTARGPTPRRTVVWGTR